MKRSNNSENLIVVTAIAIAVSLLASACGPGKMKTVLQKGTGGKIAKTLVEGKETTTTEISTTDKLVKAAQEKRAESTNLSPVEVSAVEEFASRITFITLREDAVGVSLTLQLLAKDKKPYFVKFTGGQLQEDKKTISFPTNLTQEITGKGLTSETTVVLPLSAQVKKIDEELSLVSIIEKNDAKSTELTAFVKINDADAVVNSKDEAVAKLKDSAFSVKTTQLYLSDDKLVHDGDLKLLNSRANKVVVLIDAKDAQKTAQYSLSSKLDTSSTTVSMTILSMDESDKALSNELYDATLIAGDAIIKSNELALQIKKKDAAKEEESSISLTLVGKKASEETSDSSEEATSETSEDEKFKIEKENIAVDATIVIGSDKANFKNVTSQVSSTEKILNEKGLKNKKVNETTKSDIKKTSAVNSQVTYTEKVSVIAKAGAKVVMSTPQAKLATVVISQQAKVANAIVENSLPAQGIKAAAHSETTRNIVKSVSAPAGAAVAVAKETAQVIGQQAAKNAKIVAATPQGKAAVAIVATQVTVAKAIAKPIVDAHKAAVDVVYKKVAQPKPVTIKNKPKTSSKTCVSNCK